MATIRPALPNDAGQIAEIQVRTWQATYRGDLPDVSLDSLDASRREEMWRHAIDHGSPVAATSVAEDANGNDNGDTNGDDTVRISGFCHAGPARDVVDQTAGEIYALYVDPTAQDHGVRTALMGATTVWMHSSGYEKAMLWVMEGNDHARAFYEHPGWRPDSAPRAAEIDGHPILEHCYRRDLPD